MGPAKVTRKYSENDRKLVAYHEAGHAVIGLKLKNASDVQKVTIIPRGSAGGYNMMIPTEEKLCSTKSDLLEEITGLLGGRTAEEITFGEITTGAHNDFEKATKIVRAMVTEYGMSDLGPLQFEQPEGSVFLGRDYNKAQHFSNEVANEIDMEMRKIINDCHKKATEIIKKNKDLLKLIAETLLEYETLTKEQIDYLVENGKMPEEDESNLESLSISKLREIAKEKGVKNYSKMNKAELLQELNEENHK
jgi:cell division protease FtsH